MIKLLKEQVEKNAQHPSLYDTEGHGVTYGELSQHARQLAAKLLADGLQKGDRVVIRASRGIGFVEAILGILMAGGVYVPLSDHYPADRTAYIQKDCGAPTLSTKFPGRS